MGHRLAGMDFVRSQCFCPTLNGLTPKTIFVNIHFENAAVLRVDVVVCLFSVVSDCRYFAGGTSGF